MRRWFLAMLLSALALFAWAPLWMLLSGSLTVSYTHLTLPTKLEV